MKFLSLLILCFAGLANAQTPQKIIPGKDMTFDGVTLNANLTKVSADITTLQGKQAETAAGIANLNGQVATLTAVVNGLPTGGGISASVTVTLPASLTAEMNGKKILVKNAGTLTLPVLPDGFSCEITNGSTGTVSLSLVGVTRLNRYSAGSIQTGSRPVMVTYFAGKIINLR